MDGSPSSGPATGDIIPGGRADLWDPVATVTVTVTNAGEVDGAEVAQLYIGFPESAGTPPRQLRGLDKLLLAAGEYRLSRPLVLNKAVRIIGQPGATIVFDLLAHSLAMWEPSSPTGQWRPCFRGRPP